MVSLLVVVLGLLGVLISMTHTNSTDLKTMRQGVGTIRLELLCAEMLRGGGVVGGKEEPQPPEPNAIRGIFHAVRPTTHPHFP